MENISIAGSGTIAGGEYGNVKIAGSGAVTGAIRCEVFSCAGSGRVQGDLDCTGKVSMAGSMHVGGSITAHEIALSGSCRVDCDFDEKINGFLHTLFGKIFKSSGVLKTDVIEGDDIELDCVEANVVRGRTVVLHGNTNIARVEYTESCTVDEGARVGETVKVD